MPPFFFCDFLDPFLDFLGSSNNNFLGLVITLIFGDKLADGFANDMEDSVCGVDNPIFDLL